MSSSTPKATPKLNQSQVRAVFKRKNYDVDSLTHFVLR